MCGIWCSVGFPPDAKHIDVVAHRGPDGYGWHVFQSPCGPVALGHRRLAIIDTSDVANQPMSYANERFWLVYNGEIYNHIELRAELETLGHKFVTRSDSEVILAAYAQWGEQCIERFVGMFAIVIYEPKAGRIFAVRDRFGIKPLYFINQRHGIAFASEIKQFIGVPDFSMRMNVARIYDFLLTGITDHTDETTFCDVKQLRQGCCATIDLAQFKTGDTLPIRQWYRLPPQGLIRMSEKEAANRFRELLADSVRLHLRSDVPIGSCLSGGLDSSSIVCLIDRHLRAEGGVYRLNTISACYEELSVDERSFIEAVSAITNTQPHYVFPHADDVMASAERITWHQDEPYGSTSIFAQWCVFARANREKIKVMLDGQGADEQLSGYHGGYGVYMASLLRRARCGMLARTILERWQYHGVPLAEQFRGALRELLPPQVASFARRQQPRGYRQWLDSELFSRQDKARDVLGYTLEREGLPRIRNIGDLCVAMTQATNLPMLLRYEDRNSMAHSVEARVPFLDHRLVEFSIGLGEAHKMVGGETKRVLRLAMAGILPEKISRRRDKLGFATPEATWFRGPLRKIIEEGVEDTLRHYPGLLHPNNTRKLVHAMLDGRRHLDFTLWRIVNIGIWGRVFSVTL